MFKIGEFSKLSQISVKTLRFYDGLALFTPAYVDRTSGYRYYLADQVNELGQILHLKTLGFSLRQIRDVMAHRSDTSRLRAMLLEKRQELRSRLREEQTRLAGLDGWLDRLAGDGEVPSHTVTLKRVAFSTVASIRTSISRYSDAVDLFAELGRYTKEIGAAAGPFAAIWHTCAGSGRAIDCEAYVHTRHPISGNRRVRAYELPASLVASVVHHGDATMCAGAYVAARSWISSNGFEITGPKRELYWRGGLDQDRGSDLTEIQFPVATSKAAQVECER